MSALDITKPATNPAFVADLDALEANDTPETRQEVALLMGEATFLVAIIGDELQFAPGAAPGQTTLAAGSKFGVLQSDDGQGGQVLPLFTDWDALRQAITRPVSALVLPASEAWQFVLGGACSGVVINPASQGIMLSREAAKKMAGV